MQRHPVSAKGGEKIVEVRVEIFPNERLFPFVPCVRNAKLPALFRAVTSSSTQVILVSARKTTFAHPKKDVSALFGAVHNGCIMSCPILYPLLRSKGGQPAAGQYLLQRTHPFFGYFALVR
jgi:hypothetical protein